MAKYLSSEIATNVQTATETDTAERQKKKLFSGIKFYFFDSCIYRSKTLLFVRELSQVMGWRGQNKKINAFCLLKRTFKLKIYCSEFDSS